MDKEQVVDMLTTHSAAMKRITLKLDYDKIRERGLSLDQITNTIAALYNPIEIGFVHTNERTFEMQNIIL